jgi:DNA-binding NtrC family response regulator
MASSPGEEPNWTAELNGLSAALHPRRTRFVAAHAAEERGPELILLRHQGWTPFLSALKSCKQRWCEARVVGLVPLEELRPEPLRQAYEQGLEDFVLAPVRMPELIARLRSCSGPEPAHDLNRWKRDHNLEALVGTSPAFEQALRRIPTLGATDGTVLVLGETGTGKELFARALHYSSARRAAGFVPVNCGALPEPLFENELFGHARGAYTDARSDASGLLSVADGGTLFLDEVDSLSSSTQVKLLRLLQNREYRPLGSTVTRTANVRVIAAANTDLRSLVQTGRFRDDLYYRLDVLRITVPPLRERGADILLLAEYFLSQLTREYVKPGLRLAPAVPSELVAHRWPGNVRELEGVMKRAVLMCEGPLVQASHLELGNPGLAATPVAGSSFQQTKAMMIAQFERTYLTDLLERCSGNVSQAARLAGKDRRAFQRLLQKRGVTKA